MTGTDEIITLDFGSGGKKTASLIEKEILPLFRNEYLEKLGDGAVLPGNGKLVFSADSFVVSPCFFPGGDIGKLAVCGTVNDLSVAGGEPRFLSLSLIIEEGFPKEKLGRILRSAAETAKEAGVSIVTGDTKVVERGHGDGIYINTSGIGFLRHGRLSADRIAEGDAVLISGTVGDHGAAVMLARSGDPQECGGSRECEDPGTEGLRSDCAPVRYLAEALMTLGDDLKMMRDPTRGGVATVLCEFADKRPFGIELTESRIPVSPGTEAACGLLGLDPLYCACEGRVLAVVPGGRAEEALRLMRSIPGGENAAVIGEVTCAHPGRVTVKTPIGGSRVLTKLTGAQLPRIC